MLVYCSQITLIVDDNDPFLPVKEVLSGWLNRKTGKSLGAAQWFSDGTTPLAPSISLEVESASENQLDYFAMRYVHPDRFVRGRKWFTELGARWDGASCACSVLLRTEASSALVAAPVQTTRPLFVPDIFAHCKVSSQTPGGKAQPLRLDDAELLFGEIANTSRRHPIVEVSPSPDGAYLADPDLLASQLAGIATVAVIQPDVNTYELEDVLSSRFCCYRGALNIVWPAITRASQAFIPNTRLMSYQLAAMKATGQTPENAVLAIICDRMNGRVAGDHVALETVRAARHRAALASAVRAAPAADPELEKLVRQVDVDQRTEIDVLKAKLKDRDNDIATSHTIIDERDAAIESLKASLAAASASSTRGTQGGVLDNARTMIERALSDDLTVADALECIAALYADRLVVLESAHKSARAANAFKQPRKVLGLLETLCTSYWEALNAGRGDSEARAVFGSAFSAKESETVEHNQRARALRSFTYNGKAVEMMKHLKIGNKTSDAETFRAYFEWDAPRRRIVLGHCGKHLDHK